MMSRVRNKTNEPAPPVTVQVQVPGAGGADVQPGLLPQQKAPNFAGQAVLNGAFEKLSLANYSGKYLVLLFYPMDWTFVCPTEIVEFSDRLDEFQAINCEVVACSTDSQYTHLSWTNANRSSGGVGKIKIPLLADTSGEIAKSFGCLKSDEGIAFRGLYIIDDKKTLRHYSITDMGVGRSADETIRLVTALKFYDEHGEVCPAGWVPGDLTIKPDVEGAKEYFNLMVDDETLEYLEEGFKNLNASRNAWGKSKLKKHLSKEILNKLKRKKTPTFGSTLKDVIQSGLENIDSGIGIYAPDAEAYTVFADLFDPIIEEYHGGFKKTDKHPKSDFGDPSKFGDLDPEMQFVVSTRIRCGRSVEGLPFNPNMTEEQYVELENKVSSTLKNLDGDHAGVYYPLTGMTKIVQQKLIDDHFLFKEGDRFLQTANACRYWPTGRGIFHNTAKTFLVWCGEEDHLRIISMQMGGNVGEVFGRLKEGVAKIEAKIPFSSDDRLGMLTFCPTNLGTTIRASVHIKLPKLAKGGQDALQAVADKFQLQVRGSAGEHSEAKGGLYDVSNRERMGLTEFDAVKKMYDGVKELIRMEQEL